MKPRYIKIQALQTAKRIETPSWVRSAPSTSVRFPLLLCPALGPRLIACNTWAPWPLSRRRRGPGPVPAATPLADALVLPTPHSPAYHPADTAWSFLYLLFALPSGTLFLPQAPSGPGLGPPAFQCPQESTNSPHYESLLG